MKLLTEWLLWKIYLNKDEKFDLVVTLMDSVSYIYTNSDFLRFL